ncbi:MAG: glycosyltransferase family 1 protein [Flavobacterium sp.]|nr:MAG: glycosyltransferase family 1 protein [Flavobacterium sp.]
MKPKLIRITTVPISLEKLLEGQLRYMNQFYNVTAISSEKEQLEKYGENEGVSIFYLPLTRKITPFQDLNAIWKLYKFLKKEKPHIVHSHTPKAGMVGMIASYFAKVPNRLHTVAGLPLMEAKGIKRKILNTVEKFTYKLATKVYPNSYGLEKIILDLQFLKKEKCKVLANGSSNGIDTEYFNPNSYSEKDKHEINQHLKISENDFVYIFVGRLVSDKGINELVTAFKNIQQKNKNTKLLLVGPLESELDALNKETLEQLTGNENIISVGYQQDVRPYFAIANVLTFPSYREGLPNVVLQAGAMGLSSIVTDINGCNEIIKQNNNGLIIPVKDKEALFNAMSLVLNEKKLTEKLTSNSRKSIVKRYQRPVVWDAILEEYSSLKM